MYQGTSANAQDRTRGRQTRPTALLNDKEIRYLPPIVHLIDGHVVCLDKCNFTLVKSFKLGVALYLMSLPVFADLEFWVYCS